MAVTHIKRGASLNMNLFGNTFIRCMKTNQKVAAKRALIWQYLVCDFMCIHVCTFFWPQSRGSFIWPWASLWNLFTGCWWCAHYYIYSTDYWYILGYTLNKITKLLKTILNTVNVSLKIRIQTPQIRIESKHSCNGKKHIFFLCAFLEFPNYFEMLLFSFPFKHPNENVHNCFSRENREIFRCLVLLNFWKAQ